MKSPINRVGGKYLLTKTLLSLIPPHSVYIEPFFGGGALFFHLEPKRAIINDINSKLISFYLGVKMTLTHSKKNYRR